MMLDRDDAGEEKHDTIVHRHRGALLLVAIGIAGFSASQFFDEIKAAQGSLASLFAGAVGVIQFLWQNQRREQKKDTREAVGDLGDELVARLAINMGEKIDRIADSLEKKHRDNQRRFRQIIGKNKDYDKLHEAHSVAIDALKHGQDRLEQSHDQMGQTLEKVNRDVGRIMGKMGLDGEKTPEDILPMRPTDERTEPPAETA